MVLVLLPYRHSLWIRDKIVSHVVIQAAESGKPGSALLSHVPIGPVSLCAFRGEVYHDMFVDLAPL